MKVTSAAIVAMTVAGAIAVPETPQKFKANVFNKVTTKMSMMDMDVEMTGVMYVDHPLRRVRNDFATLKMKMKMDMGGMGGDGGEGGTGGLPDGFPSGLGRRLLSPMGMTGNGMEIEMAGDGTELLRFDMGKNFTWFTDGGKTTCTCEPLVEEMTPYYVDPAAMEGTPESILVNGVDVQTDTYSSSLDMGVPGAADMGFSMDYFVDGSNHLRRVTSKINMGGEGVSMDMTTTTDMWNIATTFDKDVWVPHPSCKCPAAAKPEIKIQTTYPAVGSVCSADKGCACISTEPAEAIEFCKDIVTWPVQASIFAKSTDDFVKTVYDLQAMALMGESDACKAELKDFLCKFYFQTCSVGGQLLAPPPIGSDTCTSAEATAGEEMSGYKEAKSLAEGNSADGNVYTVDTNAASGVAASPIVAVALAAAALALA